MPEPTITSKNLPPTPPAKPMPPPTNVVEAQVPWDQIEAKPLRQPNFIALRHKNPNMCLYWGNRAVGEKESGLRFDQLISMGFVPAKPTDVVSNLGEACPPSLQRDGRIMYGDLILLMIPRVDYIGVLKWNEQNARLRVKKPGVAVATGASQDIGGREVLADTGGRKSLESAGFPKKVSTYVPPLAEVDSKTADNSGPEVNLAEKS